MEKNQMQIIYAIQSKEIQRQIGSAVLDFQKQYNFKVSDIKEALVETVNEHKGGWSKKGAEYDEDTIGNFLYRSWPHMPTETTILIITEAFESLLKKEKRADEFEEAKEKIRCEIERIYTENTENSENLAKTSITRTIAEYLFTFEYTEDTLFLSKYFDAFTSLTSDDIEFWEIISALEEKDRKNCYSYTELNAKKIDFKTVSQPDFYQWLTIRNKDFADSARKDKVGKSRLSKDFKARIDKLTGDQATSLLTVLYHLQAKQDEKYPLGPKDEIDLLILFKYFVPDEKRDTVLNWAKEKSTGDK